MPPRTLTTNTITSKTLTDARAVREQVQTFSASLPPTLMGPGLYELYNAPVDAQGNIPSSWQTAPLRGRVHVAWDGSALTETWVLHVDYTRVGDPLPGSALAGVVVKCTQGGPPPALGPWLAGLNLGGTGAVKTTWVRSPPSAAQRLASQRMEHRSGVQCSPGSVEIVSMPTGNGLGGVVGFVDTDQTTFVSQNWRACAFSEEWYFFAGLSPLGAGQTALLRPAGEGACAPSGVAAQVWPVTYVAL